MAAQETQLPQKNGEDETHKKGSPESSCFEEMVHQPFDSQNRIEQDLAVQTQTVRHDDGDLEPDEATATTIVEMHTSDFASTSFHDHTSNYAQPASCDTNSVSNAPCDFSPLSISMTFVPSLTQEQFPRSLDFFVAKTKTFDHAEGSPQEPTELHCSLTQNSIDNFEQSAGGCPLFQDVDHVSSGIVQLSQTAIEPKRKGGAGAFFHRVLLNSNHYQNSSPDDKWIWKADEEFASELLAGVNPVVIAKLKEFLPTSNLDPTLFGEQNSTITTEHAEKNLDGLTTEQALNCSKLFILKMVQAKALKLTQASEVSVFDDMPLKGLISWSVMINGLVQNNRFKEALELLNMMLMEKEANESIYVSSICAHHGAIEQGRWMDNYLLKKNFTITLHIDTAMIDMYLKCGSVENAFNVFNLMQEKNPMTWSTMIIGLAINGRGEDSLKLFSLIKYSGISPNELTFIGVLHACSQLKLVDEGVKYLKSMVKIYNIQPDVHHYCCLFDLYGKAGMLAKAEEVIKNMPMEPNSAIEGPEFREKSLKQLMELIPRIHQAIYIIGHGCFSSKGGITLRTFTQPNTFTDRYKRRRIFDPGIRFF